MNNKMAEMYFPDTGLRRRESPRVYSRGDRTYSRVKVLRERQTDGRENREEREREKGLRLKAF